MVTAVNKPSCFYSEQSTPFKFIQANWQVFLLMVKSELSMKNLNILKLKSPIVCQTAFPHRLLVTCILALRKWHPCWEDLHQPAIHQCPNENCMLVRKAMTVQSVQQSSEFNSMKFLRMAPDSPSRLTVTFRLLSICARQDFLHILLL